MGAVKKFKQLYREKSAPSLGDKSEQDSQNKRIVEGLRQKINEKIAQDEEMQKKAALILERLINQNPNKF